ncbi:CFAP61 [Symbiodinium sp. CCMP2592]|nr:CFAP61 [Symbiodinium sp. CCMP2592]
METEELMAMNHWAAPSPEGHPPMVLCCNRSQVIAPLGIRIARVEDHDNLAAVFDAQSEVVTAVYGDFFIAELVEAQNDENRALVAEVDGRAVGLMCLTSDVDINVLAQCFQLDPYDNLLKAPYMKRVREHARAVLEHGEQAGSAGNRRCCNLRLLLLRSSYRHKQCL